MDALRALRRQLRPALGLGVTREAGFRGANRRGRIAEYGPDISRELGATHGRVVTESRYSGASLQETAIPPLNAMAHEATPGDVLVQNTLDWRGRLALRLHPLLLAVPMITTVHERDSITRYTRTIVSEAARRDVEAALVLHFGL
ncbi:MAG TPA: hypothetical protein VF142_05075 [Longimicrobium sp.]